MKKSVLFVSIILLGSSNIFAQSAKEIEGAWVSTLDLGVTIRIVLHFRVAGDSIVTVLDSPDQGANGIPTGSTTYSNRDITVMIPKISAIFKGTYYPDSNKINGDFMQMGKTYKTSFSKMKEDITLGRSQDPKPPYPYKIEEVTFANPKAGGVTLAGTLTIPEGKGPFPTVVMVTGSGPQNRDEFLLGHSPFWVIADHLSRNGIAVLRYDDRGTAKSTGDFASATSADFATDALAAVGYLKTRPEVDQNKIGIAGHSEGGLIAPMAAVESKDVHFIILLAGPGLRGDVILKMQGALILKSNGIADTLVAKYTAMQDDMFALIRNDKSSADLNGQLQAIFKQHMSKLSEAERLALNVKPDDELPPFDDLISPWMKYFISYDPVPVLQKVTVPVLALNGSKDLQVPPKEDLEAIKTALTAGGNKHVTAMELDGLNHLFQHCKKCTVEEYSILDETFSEDAMKLITDWILALK